LAIPLSLLGLPAASAAHTVDGRPPWWNAKAGAAITLSISAEAKAATKTLLSLLNLGTSSGCLPTGVHTEGNLTPVDEQVLTLATLQIAASAWLDRRRVLLFSHA
jgi:hypothetical protein